MATVSELAQRLLTRFKNVPNVATEDTHAWVEDSALEHGYSADADIPDDKQSLILLYAQANGTEQVALNTAHYFSYSDGDESVTKAGTSQRYLQIARELWDRYQLSRQRRPASSAYPKRADQR
jgi:hypothetical protein